MTARVLLLLLAMMVSGASQVWADDLEQAARDAVVAKRFRDAAALYAELSAREPANTDYLLWIGRLSSWMQEYQAALDAYESALTRAPRNVEALVGRASVLMWQQKFSDACRDLAQAEQLEPHNADVQLAFARFHHYQREERLAQARVRSALALAPESREARELESQIILPRSLQFTVGYGRDDFSFASAGNLGFVTAGYVGARERFAFQYERWDKFGEVADRAGVSVSGRTSDRVWLRGSVMFAPRSTVLARQDYSVGFSRSWPGGFVVGGDYRRLELDDVHVHIVSPGVEYYFADRPVWLQGVFSESRTTFDAPVRTRALNPSILLRYNQQLSETLVMHVGYARGQESFAALSIDQLGRFRANTYSGSVDIRVSPASSIALSYAHQERSSGARQRTFGIGVSLRK